MTTPQPFSPIEFYNLGLQLGTAPTDETKLRAAVGRVYYALFLISRGRTHPGRGNIPHSEVIKAVGRRADPGTKQKLDSLFRMRKVADYDLVPVRQGDRDWAVNWSTVQATAAQILPRLQKM